MTHIQGKRFEIRATSNKFAQADVGKAGVVIGEAPLGMVILLLDDGREYWAETYNLNPVSARRMREDELDGAAERAAIIEALSQMDLETLNRPFVD